MKSRKLVLALLPALVLGMSAPAWAGDKQDDAQIAQAQKDLQAARAELQRATQEMLRATREIEKNSPKAWALDYMSNPLRAVIGVIIDAAPERNGVSPGVIVEAVTPGGGADKAGIKSGDIIVSANGQSLEAKRGALPPDHKMMTVMASVEPGKEVKLDYERDGKRASAVAVAQRPDPRTMQSFRDDPNSDVLMVMPPMAPVPPAPPVPGMAPLPPLPPLPPPAPQVLRWSAGGPDFQLATLDDDLASYFKTKSGVLVVKAPKDGKLGLKGGDVIQKIGGKTIKDPRGVLDALHEGAPGDAIKLQVMRGGKVVALDAVIPDLSHRIERIEFNSTP